MRPATAFAPPTDLGLDPVHARQAWAVASSGVDPWDVAARLEAAGVSDRVATSAGYPSVFGLAHHLMELRDPDRVERYPGVERRPAGGVVAAILRALVMVAGVGICVSTLPRDTSEPLVFAIAAGGWLAGQGVSSGIWHAWGRGSKSDGVLAGVAIGVVALVAGLVGVWFTGAWTIMIWVGWSVSAPLLLVLRPGPLLTLVTVAMAGVCVLPRMSFRGFSGFMSPLTDEGTIAAGVATASMVVAAALAAGRALTGARARRRRGTLLALLVALIQTTAQLLMLYLIFDLVGASAFGAVAVAGLSAGILADPLFACTQAWTSWVTHRSSSWWRGRFAIGASGLVITALMLWVAIMTAFALLSDPYRIFLNEAAVVAAAVLSSAVIVATNALLRTGTALGAMAYAGGAAALVAAIWALYPTMAAGDLLLIGAAALVSLLAALVVAWRLASPRSW